MRAIVPLFILSATGFAAPALGDRPAKYEFAELRYGRVFEAVPNPGVVGQGGGVRVAKTSIRWTTAEEEIECSEWEELAKKLKAPEPKKEGNATIHKLRVMNRLSADGWEMVPAPIFETGGNAGVWQFRRRVQ